VVCGRNEAKTIPTLLESVSEFLKAGGDFVYVDTGSTDGTPKIAGAWGCRVWEEGDRFRYVCDEETAKAINEKFVVGGEPEIIKAGDAFFAFDQARNYAMTLAKNDFICTPDCDEAWTVLNIEKLNKLIDDGYEKLMVDFVFAHFPDGKPAVEFAADTRLYDRRKIKWKGIIHETMQHQGDVKMGRVGRDVAYLEHYQNKETDRTRYLAGLAWACHQESTNDRNSHYFARELMYRGFYKSAIQEFQRHIDMNQWADERGQSMVYMGSCHEALGHDDAAREWWHRAFELTGTRREPLINLANYYRRQNKPVLVGAYAAAALQIPNNGFYANRVANYTFEPHALMYWAKGWQGDIPAAREHWLKCYDYHPDDPTFIRDFDYYFAKPKVSVVIPTLRPDKLERCLEALKKNAGYDNYEIIVEPDDPENPQGAPKVLKRGVEKSTGELVMFLGDDTIPQENFMFHAVVAMHKNFPELDGLVGLNDMYWHGEFFTHWLASKKLLPFLGGEFFHTGYYHLACDNELTDRCRTIGKAYYCERAKVLHDHPGIHQWSEETYDKHYQRVYQFDRMEHDRRLLEERSKLLGFTITPPDYSWMKVAPADEVYTNSIPGWMEEPDIQFLYNTAKNMGSVVEIGCWKGRSTHALCSGCAGMVYAVDHFGGSIAPQAVELEKQASWDEVYADFLKNVGHFGNLDIHRKKSLEVVSEFSDRSVDMVFIDGEHLYDHVKADIEAWLPKTKKMICGHDYIDGVEGVDVIRAVKDTLGEVKTVPGGRIWYKELA
jgi:tetratricopeptide (TPR) repeat protein